jgi:hypothetical protein
MGLVFAYLIDFKSSKVVERSAAAPFGRGVRLPRSSVEGDVSFSPGGRSVSFRKRPGRRDISVRWPRFGKSGDLSAEISLSEPEGRRSIVMATLISDRRFYYNVKTPAMPAEGEVRLGSSAIRFTPADSFAVLDWGRGVWPYRTFWNWASAQGRLPDGRVFGLNLGQGFGDLSAATENCFFLDGAMHKLEGVEWRYERGKWLSPWMFEGDDGRTRLRMTPILDRSSSINLLVLKSEVHQVFGKWEGTLAAEGGSLLEFSGITGWAEAHEARW